MPGEPKMDDRGAASFEPPRPGGSPGDRPGRGAPRASDSWLRFLAVLDRHPLDDLAGIAVDHRTDGSPLRDLDDFDAGALMDDLVDDFAGARIAQDLRFSDDELVPDAHPFTRPTVQDYRGLV